MDEISEDFEKALNLDNAQHPLGPIFEGFYEEHGFHMDLAGKGGKAELLKRMLYDIMIVPTDPKLFKRNAKFIPGATMDNKVGPRRNIKVVFIGKLPDDSSAPLNRAEPEFNVVPYIDQLLGYTKDFLVKAFQDTGIPENTWRNFYITNLCRFPRIDAGRKKNLPAAWIKEGLPFIEQELKIIKPDVIVCMGTDASKKIVGYPITKAISNVFDYDIDGHTAKAICVYDPKKVIEDPEERPLFLSGMESLKNLLEGGDATKERNRSKYHYINTAKELRVLVDRLIAEGVTDFAIDCEWGGKHYLDTGAGLRTVQLGWSEDECAVIILRRCGMKSSFEPYVSSAFSELRRLLQRTGIRFIGHGISADFPWLKDAGLDLSGQVYFDTLLASHLFEPTMSHKLEDLATKHIRGWVRQDFELTKWLDEHPKAKDNGYADVPDNILHPYSGDDVVSTYLLYQHYQERFEQPENRGLTDLFYGLVMPALLPLIDIEMTGVYMDRERTVGMQRAYSYGFSTLLERFRNMNGVPNFNPNSSNQKSDLLFNQLGLTPVKTTDDPPMLWEEVMEERLEGMVSPAVDGETLEILSAESSVAKDLHNITLLATVLKNQLVPPSVDVRGNLVYTKGFTGFIKPDGRIHTRISQMLKTGRLASLDPNIMNIANKQESAVQTLFKSLGLSVPKLRSAFTVPPGKMLIVADYKQAELAALAYASGDESLIQAIKEGQDIHSVVCRQMFQLDCSLADVKRHHKHLRVAAKSIVFG
jgi:uracil-DNA glycosylase family 4